MRILGISYFYHDSAACLVEDGKIVAAAQEERFTRKKHDAEFPKKATQYCLEEAGVSPVDIDIVAFYEKPIVKFDRILQSAIAFAPHGIRRFLAAMPLWLKDRLWVREHIRKELPGFSGRIVFPSHHESHAASAFFPSPFDTAAILTLDAVGEWNTTTYGIGEVNRIALHKAINFPHSLGMLYSAFTYYTGFKVNSGEYKVMGLAPYGAPRYADRMLNHCIDVKEDGSFRLNMDYFDYCAGFTMTNRRFHRLFGGPPRKPESPLTERDMDLAASIQKVTEEIMTKIVRHVVRETGVKKLVMAGGVALNCVANGRILREGIVDDIWIQPAATDAGGALGAALYVWYQYLGNPRNPNGKDAMRAAHLGPSYSDEEIRTFLDTQNATYMQLSRDELITKTAALIAEGKVVGWFQGRMEFGPRALGARSILGDARNQEMQTVMNVKIKFRESFRPFAPSVLIEHAKEYFEGAVSNPYMLLTFPVSRVHRISPEHPGAKGLQLLKQKRSTIPAVTHVDYSARIQTVSGEDNPLYYDLIHRFYKKTGCPVIINTSFNVRGEPIVCTPQEAWRCFMRTNMDYLAIGSFLLAKKDQKPYEESENWKKALTDD